MALLRGLVCEFSDPRRSFKSSSQEELSGRLRCQSYLRTVAQFVGILCLCLAGAWILDYESRSRPTTISGTVVDWKSGRLATHADVLLRQLNSVQIVAQTDELGRFSFVAPDELSGYFLFAGRPHNGTLLQVTFGQLVMVYRPAAQVRDVVLPAIQATELSGHVYGMEDSPLSGCEVSAVTRERSTAIQDLDPHSVWAMVESDDPNKLLATETKTTDAGGYYSFSQLGADRYFVLARCRESERGIKVSRGAWEPMAYPQSASLAHAEEIVLLPGDQRNGVDFHLRRKPSYSVEGRVVFSDHSAPKSFPEAIYFHDLKMLRTDHPLGSASLSWETCDWEANTGVFRCSSLLPGVYSLYFELSGGPGSAAGIATQFARVTYTVKESEKQVPLIVQLENAPKRRSITPPDGPTGFLDFRKACDSATQGRPAIEVWAQGHNAESRACYLVNYAYDTRWPLPEDAYAVTAFEASFFARPPSAFVTHSKLGSLLLQRGTAVSIRAGRTSEPELPVLRTKDLIEMALASLRLKH